MPRLDSSNDPADRPSWVDRIDNPYLHGVHAPTVHETTAHELPVEGELPADLFGAYVRNGPNAVFEPTNPYHWFDGDGMLHAVYFHDGKASYRSRFVRTAGLADEAHADRAIWPGVMGPFDFDRPRGYLKDTANTDVIHHNGDLLALWYLCGKPYRVDPLTLEPRGVADFGGKLASTVSAHPKVDERTGELVWFTLTDEPPYMQYGVVDKSGALVHQIPVELPGARTPHDLTITERFTILHDFPLFYDPQEMRKTGYRIVRFHRDIPSRFALVPRRGSPDQIRWFEFEPGYVLHMVNAWEDGDWIVMDGCFQPDPTIRRRQEEGPLASMLGYLRVRANLHRWRMNLVTGETEEHDLDDLNVEFCLPDTDRYGEKTRYSWHQYLPTDMYTVEFRSLVEYDHEDGSCTRYDYGDGVFASEAPFARRRGASDPDEGYVVTIVTHADDYRSECWVFVAGDIAKGPIAKVRLPSRVPTGFHAKWVRGDLLYASDS